MGWTPERGNEETEAAADFFQKYPSDASKTVTWFQSLWNTFETFDDYPLQAFMYATASPVTTPEDSGSGAAAPEERLPATPMWEAYARASEEGLDASVIDEAYFRAHIDDMKSALKSDRFQELYDLAPSNYRVVVEAYAETVARAEQDLAEGRPIQDVSRGLFVDGLRDLVDRGTVGMLHNQEGFANMVFGDDKATAMLDRSLSFFGFLGTPDRNKEGVFDNVLSWFESDAAFTAAVEDGTVEIHEIWELTQNLRGFFSGELSGRDLRRIRAFGDQNRAHLTGAAADLLDKLVAHGPDGPTTQEEIEAAPHVDASGPVTVELSTEDIEYMREELGITVPNGATELTSEMFANASFAEPDRREDRSTPVKRWPLKLSDLVDRQLRRGLTKAGTDGVLQFDEIMGGIRTVQGRVRSELIEEFAQKYPIAPGGILTYSANVLSLHKTYGENEFYGMVPNAIMPVDNDGNAKNQLWRDFTEAYDLHKVGGTPSKEELEKLWIRAHMQDFAAVDAPEFQGEMDKFWEAAAFDPALESMAIYTKAMVLGRGVFDEAREQNRTEAAAMAESMKHFVTTMASSGTFAFWKEDVGAIVDYVTGGKDEPSHDERGLPTDRTFAERAARGALEMGQLTTLVAQGFSQKFAGTDRRVPTDELLDITEGMTPEEVASIDPMVIDFYKNPTNYDLTAVAELPALHQIFSKAMTLFSGMGTIPTQGMGENSVEPAVVEQSLWRDPEDPDGHTHWDRDVVIDGEKHALFHATMGMEGGKLKETFDIRGVEVPLYFDVTPFEGGVKIELDRERSSGVAPKNIVFTAVPNADGMLVNGTYEMPGSETAGNASFHVRKRADQGV